MSLRARLFLTSILLLLALSITLLTANASIQAFHTWQQQEVWAGEGDGHLLRNWMTIPYIAHVYHVPEDYLYQSLHINKTHETHNSSLTSIALHTKQPVSLVMNKTQSAIQSYHRQHLPHQFQPRSTPTKQKTKLSGEGRVEC